MPRTEPAGKHLAVHARKLALEAGLQIVQRHRRPLLRCMEQAHRPAMAHHVDRYPRLGLPVVISESWYQIIVATGTATERRLNCASSSAGSARGFRIVETECDYEAVWPGFDAGCCRVAIAIPPTVLRPSCNNWSWGIGPPARRTELRRAAAARRAIVDGCKEAATGRASDLNICHRLRRERPAHRREERSR